MVVKLLIFRLFSIILQFYYKFQSKILYYKNQYYLKIKLIRKQLLFTVIERKMISEKKILNYFLQA